MTRKTNDDDMPTSWHPMVVQALVASINRLVRIKNQAFREWKDDWKNQSDAIHLYEIPPRSSTCGWMRTESEAAKYERKLRAEESNPYAKHL